MSTRKIVQQIDLSYQTALKAVTLIGKAIVANSIDAAGLLRGEVGLDEVYFSDRRKSNHGRGPFNKAPVFGSLERNGIAKVKVGKDVSASTLIDLTIKIVKRGSLIYADKFRSYGPFIFCSYHHLCNKIKMRFSTGKVNINGLEGFWSYVKRRLIKHHGF